MKHFESMNTRDIQDWLKGAQIYLDKANHPARLITMEAIKYAAEELRIRYKYHIQGEIMYNIDFISATIGYIMGVFLCYNTMHVVYNMENNDDE